MADEEINANLSLRGNLSLRTEQSAATELSIQRTDSDTTNPLAQIKMFGSGKDDFQGVLAFETINSGSSDGPTEERMRIHTNGNVGIGTDDPKAPLHVANYMAVGPFSATGGEGGIDVTGSAAELGFVKRTLTSWPAKPVAGDRFVWYNPNGTARLWTHGKGDLVTVKSTGEVGIGTTEPNTKLHIFGGKDASLKNDSGFLVVGSVVGTNIVMDDNEIMARNKGKKSALHLQAEGGALIVHNLKDESKKFIIKDSGNVGIGTADPGDKLTISEGDLKIEGGRYRRLKIVSDRYWAGIELVAMEKGEAGNPHIDFTHGELDSPNYGIRIYAPTNDKFVIQGGNVGIGTASPSAKLHVEGDFMIDGDFRIDGDFEFPKNSKVKFDMGGYNVDYESPDWNISVGDTQYFHGSSWFYKRFSINDDGDLYCAGSKAGYVVDYFVNRVGDTLEQGDVVVISKYQVSHYSGDKNNIPIPEVDLTDRAYDSRVCGIISKVVTEKDLPCVEAESDAQAEPMNPEEKKHEEVVPSKHPLREFAAKISGKMDYTKVQDKQIGQMVTMGCFAHCTVDADITPIEMGDLLTTSPTKGHAQKVLEPEKAVGAIIGKALGSLQKGKGKIPILVMLQ